RLHAAGCRRGAHGGRRSPRVRARARSAGPPRADGGDRPRHDRRHQRAPRAEGRPRRAPDDRGPPRRHRDARGPEGRPVQPPYAAARAPRAARAPTRRARAPAVRRHGGGPASPALRRRLPGEARALARYLERVAAELRALGYRGDVLVMQSHGGVAPVRESARLAAGAVLSGPAGGVAAGRYAARLLAEGNLITFDMGGTSTDIALLQRGEPQLTGEKRVGIARVALPALDIHTLGAGGGSVAWVDPGRILHVGPESAGADPGPACYAKGGARATVTDANLVLGYLDPGNFLGGRIPLDAAAAQGALAEVARRLGTSVLTAAEGVSRVVSTNMAEGIKIVSVRRGVDPRRFALVAVGGAAGLHVTEVARLLQIRRVVVP